MYRIYQNSKIVINRHGEVSREYANNMRMYEATGCGALLVTEDKDNLKDLFEPYKEVTPYKSTTEAISLIDWVLNNWDRAKEIAIRGQARTLRDHTYERRMKTVSDTLLEQL